MPSIWSGLHCDTPDMESEVDSMTNDGDAIDSFLKGKEGDTA